jgi:hypothetical protein
LGRGGFGRCEERSDEPIHCAACKAGLLRFARNDGLILLAEF